jgi:hypothetical protein
VVAVVIGRLISQNLDIINRQQESSSCDINERPTSDAAVNNRHSVIQLWVVDTHPYLYERTADPIYLAPSIKAGLSRNVSHGHSASSYIWQCQPYTEMYFRLCCAKSNCRNTKSIQCRSWARCGCSTGKSSILRGKLLTLA